MTNRVVHFDIHVDDVERALAFYQTVFGWTIQKVEWMDYWLSKTAVKDVKHCVCSALAAGESEAHQPGPIPGVGYVGYVRHTERNYLGLMQRDPSAK